LPITPRNLIKHELIGLNVEVSASTNRYLVGIKGRVVDETKNMLVIRTDSGVKRVPKKSTKFIFTLPDKRKVEVEGNLIIGRPENRIFKKVRKW